MISIKTENESFYQKKKFFYSTPTRKTTSSLKEPLYALDETADFHDPFSDLSLFLTEKIRKVIYQYQLQGKWSLKSQNILLREITPDFQKEFPEYRLGTAAVKKMWEKICCFSRQVQEKKEAINQDGKLNLSFFIRENLKQSLLLENAHDLSYQYTHELALKIGEYIAMIDGEKPKIDYLTKIIWTSQKNLLCEDHDKRQNPKAHDIDKLDRQIIRMILETVHQNPEISQQELQYKIKEDLRSLYELPGFGSLDTIICNIAALLAQKFYPHSRFHCHFRAEQKKAILDFIHRHIAFYKNSSQAPQPTDFVRRTLSLYSLATKLPKNLDKHQIKEAILSTYPVSKLERPAIDQIVYAFISAEIVLLKNKDYCYSIDYVTQSILDGYEIAAHLPIIEGADLDLLEMMIWKTINDQEGLLEKLPYLIGHKIDEKIAKILINRPLLNFKGTLLAVTESFKSIKELALCKKWDEVEKRIYIWAIQREMSCRLMQIDENSLLVKEIMEKSKTRNDRENHDIFVSEVCLSFLRKHPSLAVYLPELTNQIWIAYKTLWYHSHPALSPYENFLSWHFSELLSKCPYLSGEEMIERLIEVTRHCLPMMPIDRDFCRKVGFLQKIGSKQDKRNT